MPERKASAGVAVPNNLGHAILQLLARQPMSGYELKSRFFASVGRGWHAYDTQIYQELKRLEAGGCTTGEVVRGRSGPDRRLFSITERGRDAVERWLVSEIDVNRTKDEFALRIWTLDLFPPDAAGEFLERARAKWTESLVHQRMSLERLGDENGPSEVESPDDVFGRQLAIELAIVTTEAKLGWLERALQVLAARHEHPHR